MELFIILLLTPLILSLGLSKLVIYWLGRKLLDIPNNRSSHTIPTPRGGGLAVVLATFIAMLIAYASGLSDAAAIYLLAPGLLMALVGISDDLLTLNIRIRLIIQLVVACIISGMVLSHTPELTFLTLSFGLAAVFGIVWLTNLYNFMDGIDGLAALQTIFVCGSMSFLFYQQGTHQETIPLMLALGSASLGFLYWNFPQAKLFMGDAGSLFIGIIFATLMVWTARDNLSTACYWLIILTVFIADASYTLIFRVATGQKFYLPHRSHLYQKIARMLQSHTKATLLIMSFNLLWLFPLTVMVQFGKLNAIAALFLAYLPALYATYRVKAGKPE
jgi:Fuc2NAc and GlcNAc transferase